MMDEQQGPPDADRGERPQRAITIKSVGLGLIAVVLLAIFEGYNYEVLRQTSLAGHYFPVLAFGGLFLLAAVWNPICHRLLPALVLNTREMVVFLAMVLMASWLPGGGFYRYFSSSLVLPWHYEQGKPQWQEYALLDYLPKEGFPLQGQENLVFVPGVGLRDREQVTTTGYVYRIKGEEQVLATEPRPVAGAEDAAAVAIGDIVVPASQVERLGVQVSVDDVGSLVVPQVHDYDKVYANYISGLGTGDRIPWEAWWPVLLFWLPIFGIFAVTITSMAIIVHRQWMRNEQLSYPLAQVGWSMLHRSPGHILPDVFRTRLFLVGVVVVLFLELTRLAHVYYPLRVPDVSLSTSFGFMWRLVPHASNAGLQGLYGFRFYLLLFGLAYFVSSEVGLTLGLSQILLLVVGVEFYVATGTQLNSSSDMPVMRAGSYLMYGLMILFVGRHYYARIIGKAFGAYRSDDSISVDGMWAARVFLVGFICLWLLLTWQFDLDWFVALLYVLVTLGTLLVFARIICETGMPYMQATFSPGLVIGKIFGFGAIGAAPLVVLYYLSTLFVIQDTRESLMPFVSNSLNVAERAGIRPRKIALIGLGAIAVCGVLAFGSRMTQYYGSGALGQHADDQGIGAAQRNLDRVALAFDEMVQTGAFRGELHEGRLVLERGPEGRLVESDPADGLEKLAAFSPDQRAFGFFIAGMFGVAVFFALRLRFAAFPLHPVLFLVWGTWPMQAGSLSFMLGWATKELVVRFGGGRVYQQLKPLFIGIIVGELLASMIGIVVGTIYYLITGDIPEPFNIFIA